jgi:hypothetical protein
MSKHLGMAVAALLAGAIGAPAFAQDYPSNGGYTPQPDYQSPSDQDDYPQAPPQDGRYPSPGRGYPPPNAAYDQNRDQGYDQGGQDDQAYGQAPPPNGDYRRGPAPAYGDQGGYDDRGQGQRQENRSAAQRAEDDAAERDSSRSDRSARIEDINDVTPDQQGWRVQGVLLGDDGRSRRSFACVVQGRRIASLTYGQRVRAQ